MRTKVVVVGFILAVLIVAPLAAHAEGELNLLVNGDFEAGFQESGVALGWERFDSGGAAAYGWYDDQWDPVVFDGEHSQLIEINSKGQSPEQAEAHRYAGIYQTVEVAPGASYELTVRGLVRSTEGDPAVSAQGYRLEWAVDPQGGADWSKVGGWTDLGWDDQPREGSGLEIQDVKTSIVAEGESLTLFLRAHKKWPTAAVEGDFNFDGLSLVGPAPASDVEPESTAKPEETSEAQPADETEADSDEALPASGVGLLLPAGAGVAGLLLIALMERRLVAAWLHQRRPS